MTCDGQPETHIPSEIRSFLLKVKLFDDEFVKKAFSWLLNVNERSILTQDVSAMNLTRNVLKCKRHHFAAHYAHYVQECLKVIFTILM